MSSSIRLQCSQIMASPDADLRHALRDVVHALTREMNRRKVKIKLVDKMHEVYSTSRGTLRHTKT